jgi:hypothetical protein
LQTAQLLSPPAINPEENSLFTALPSFQTTSAVLITPWTPKEPDMKKKIVPAELTPSEREELIRLRAENEYLRTENEVIKKRIALRQEKFAAQLKAKKLHSSTNFEEKDTL